MPTSPMLILFIGNKQYKVKHCNTSIIPFSHQYKTSTRSLRNLMQFFQQYPSSPFFGPFLMPARFYFVSNPWPPRKHHGTNPCSCPFPGIHGMHAGDISWPSRLHPVMTSAPAQDYYVVSVVTTAPAREYYV